MWWLALSAIAGVRPAALVAMDGCELYVGTASGNDPTVLVEMRLCPVERGQEGAVGGLVQWSSTTSGWSSREITGHWSGEQLLLSDVRLVEDRPEPGWRFCTIDRYELTRDATYLDGGYRSAACDDEAVLHLLRVGDPVPHEPDVPPGPMLVVSACGGTGCATGGGVAPWWLLGLVAVRRRS